MSRLPIRSLLPDRAVPAHARGGEALEYAFITAVIGVLTAGGLSLGQKETMAILSPQEDVSMVEGYGGSCLAALDHTPAAPPSRLNDWCE